MTSRTSKKRLNLRGTWNAERGTGDRSSEFRVPSSEFAFTLIEVLLSLVLIAILAGTVVVGMAGGRDPAKLDEGSRDFETLMRLCRAEAAASGRSIRITFAEDGSAAVEWEPDPLGSPGVFTPYPENWARHSVPNGSVRVLSCAVVGGEAYQPEETSTVETNVTVETQRLDPILFRPDGSCDSLEVRLRSTDLNDPRTAIVKHASVAGSFTRTILTTRELEALDEAKE